MKIAVDRLERMERDGYIRKPEPKWYYCPCCGEVARLDEFTGEGELCDECFKRMCDEEDFHP